MPPKYLSKIVLTQGFSLNVLAVESYSLPGLEGGMQLTIAKLTILGWYVRLISNLVLRSVGCIMRFRFAD